MVWYDKAPIAEIVCFWDCCLDCLPFAVPVAAGQEEHQNRTGNVVLRGFLEKFLGETVPGSFWRLSLTSRDSADITLCFKKGCFWTGLKRAIFHDLTMRMGLEAFS